MRARESAHRGDPADAAPDAVGGPLPFLRFLFFLLIVHEDLFPRLSVGVQIGDAIDAAFQKLESARFGELVQGFL